jgi:hypothetical protein
MSREVICWPTSAPVCLAAYEDNAGGSVRTPYLIPRNLDWRKGASETYWTMAPHRAADRMVPDAFYGVEVVGDAEDRRIRIGWPWRRGIQPTHVLTCYDTAGSWNCGRYASESIRAVPADQGGTERSVFTYVRLAPAEDGRQRVALACCHARVAQLSERFEHPMLTATFVNEPGVAITIDQPVLRAWVEVTAVHEPDQPTAGQPAIDYRAHLANPTSEVLQKELTFSHEKATTGTWNNEVGISLSVGASVEIGAEAAGFSAKSSYHWEMTADARRSWGGSEAETQTVQDSTTILVPPSTELDVHILTRRQRVNVPFEYLVHRVGLDGEELEPVPDTGVYEKVETLGTDVRIQRVKALSASPRGERPRR